MKTKFSLQDKTVLLTGGGNGIGKAIATTFANQNAKVHLLDVDMKAAEETVAEIEKKGGKGIAHSCDVSDSKQVIQLVKKIE